MTNVLVAKKRTVLIEHRKKLNLSQREVAQKLGVTQATISRYENGEHLANMQIAQKLSKLYQVSVDSLFFNN